MQGPNPQWRRLKIALAVASGAHVVGRVRKLKWDTTFPIRASYCRLDPRRDGGGPRSLQLVTSKSSKL